MVKKIITIFTLLSIFSCSEDIQEKIAAPYIKGIKKYKKSLDFSEKEYYWCEAYLPFFEDYKISYEYSYFSASRYSTISLFYKNSLVYSVFDFTKSLKLNVIGTGKWKFKKMDNNQIFISLIKKEISKIKIDDLNIEEQAKIKTNLIASYEEQLPVSKSGVSLYQTNDLDLMAELYFWQSVILDIDELAILEAGKQKSLVSDYFELQKKLKEVPNELPLEFIIDCSD